MWGLNYIILKQSSSKITTPGHIWSEVICFMTKSRGQVETITKYLAEQILVTNHLLGQSGTELELQY